MKLFDVYPLFDIHLEKGEGCYVWDNQGIKYLDFYGGHAVISIGHCQEHFVNRLEKQMHRLSYYSNSVHMEIQQQLADMLGRISGYNNYSLFLCNSGAEAIENALKIASFKNKRKKVIAIKGSFHGRTSGAVAITDNPIIKAPINDDDHVLFVDLNDERVLRKLFLEHEICAVVLEPIQGVNGIYEANADFLLLIRELCTLNKAFFIADEIQSGYGRTGKFFAHQWAEVQPDLITIAKGMGNGYPIAGVLVHPDIQAAHGMLGTTFGGAPLACAAGLAVLEVIESESLLENAFTIGNEIKTRCKSLPHVIEVRGKGLMIGVEFDFPIKALRNQLVYEHHIFTGNSVNPNTIRLLPSLTVTNKEVDELINAFIKLL